MKNLFKNAAQVASKAMNKEGFATTGTVVAAGILGVFGILPKAEESVVDTSDFTDADSDKVTETIVHVSKATDNDFILADEAPSVQEEKEEVEEEEETQEETQEEQEIVEVEEVESDDAQDLASEAITEVNQSIQQATEQVAPQAPQSQPVNNNTGREEREAEARRAEAARQAEAEAQQREETARIAAEEEAARRAAEEEAARIAAQQIEVSHNQPNVLLRNGSVVAEGAGRVWYYNGPIDGLSYTDNSGNVKSGNINSIHVNANYVSQDGINYSSYTNGRMAPIVIQQTDGGYILHMFGR